MIASQYERNLGTGEFDEAVELPTQDIPTDSGYETGLQVQEAVSHLSEMSELSESTWGAMDINQRCETLQNVEYQMAEIQGRPFLPVSMTDLPGTTFGQCDGTQIQINQKMLESSEMPASEFVNTVVHEGRHAYQVYAVEHPGFHSNETEVQAWAENFKPENYLTPQEYGQELYQQQPVEADAWSYATQITASLYTAVEEA